MKGYYYYQRKRISPPKVEVESHDWPSYIKSIRSAGVTVKALCIDLDANPKTLANYSTGRTQPTHRQGEYLIRLHGLLAGEHQ